jgi:polyisoprenoid-binding protein YceI
MTTNRIRRSGVAGALATSSLLLISCGSSSPKSTTPVAPAESTISNAAGQTQPPTDVSADPSTPETATTVGAPTDAATTVAAEPAAGAASAESIEGTWKIADGAEAGYRVPEILNGQKTEGVGRTKSITGSMTIAGTKVTATEFVFDLTKLASDSGKRDNQVQTRIMETSKFPDAKFVLGEPIDIGKIPDDKKEITIPAKGSLTVHGTTKPVTLDLKARRNGANIEVLGSFDLKFADWGIPDPSFKPFVEVGSSGFIEWLLVFSKG